VENKKYVIRLNGELIPVTEEVYREYYASERHARYLEEKDARHGVVSFSALDTDELRGEEAIPDILAQSVEDGVIQKIMLALMRECLDALTSGERELVDALFFSNGGDGMSEREYAKSSGIPQKTISDRKRRTLAKLRVLIESKNISAQKRLNVD
jgi:RNA polymerase sigma factor (sigma-70 family)